MFAVNLFTTLVKTIISQKMARDPKTNRTDPAAIFVFPCQDLGISTVQLGLSEHPPHATVGLGNHLDMKVS